MWDASSAPDGSRPVGLYESLKSLLATLLAIVHTRAELLANELEEERVRVEQRVALFLAGYLFLGLGLFFLTAWVAAALWDSHRLAVLGAAALLYLGLAAAAAWRLRVHIREKPRLFAASLAELAKDRREAASRE